MCAPQCEPAVEIRFFSHFLLTGRSGYLEWSKAVEGGSHVSEDSSHFGVRFQAMIYAREQISAQNAQNIISAVQRSKLRPGAKETYELGDHIARWIPSLKKWCSGYRFLCDVGRNVIIELGDKMRKVHLQFAKAHIGIPSFPNHESGNEKKMSTRRR